MQKLKRSLHFHTSNQWERIRSGAETDINVYDRICRSCADDVRVLARNKMRTALTMLGITIGIGAVICTVAIGEGGSQQIRNTNFRSGRQFGVGGGWRAEREWRDVLAMTILNRSPMRMRRAAGGDSAAQSVLTKYRRPHPSDLRQQNWTTHFRGTGMNFLRNPNWPHADSGSNFDPARCRKAGAGGHPRQNSGRSTVPSRGRPQSAKNIHIGGLPFKVIGVLATKGHDSLWRGPGRHSFDALHHRAKKADRTAVARRYFLLRRESRGDRSGGGPG